MKFLDKWFPVWFTLPFLMATVDIESIESVSSVSRWVVLCLCALGGFSRGFPRGRGRASGWQTLDSCLVFFLGCFALSALWSFEPMYSFQRSVSMGLLYLTAFWFVWDWVDRRSVDRFLYLVLWTMGVVMGLNLLVGGVINPASVAGSRFHGFFVNPNNIGLMAALAVPLSFFQMLRTKTWWDRGLWFVFVMNMLACGSRTAMVASILAMAGMIGVRLLHNRRSVIGIAVLLVIGVTSLSQTDFFKDRVFREGSLETMSNRTLFWDLATKHYIPRKPNLGHGFGTDRDIHSHYGVVLSTLQLRGYGVMSSYYGLAVAMGIPFTILFFGVLWLTPVVFLVRYTRDSRMIAYASVMMAGLLVCITESVIYSAGNSFSFLFWSVVMLMFRRWIYRKNKVALTRSGALRRGSPV